jgi:hypothetical protein
MLWLVISRRSEHSRAGAQDLELLRPSPSIDSTHHQPAHEPPHPAYWIVFFTGCMSRAATRRRALSLRHGFAQGCRSFGGISIASRFGASRCPFDRGPANGRRRSRALPPVVSAAPGRCARHSARLITCSGVRSVLIPILCVGYAGNTVLSPIDGKYVAPACRRRRSSNRTNSRPVLSPAGARADPMGAAALYARRRREIPIHHQRGVGRRFGSYGLHPLVQSGM